MCNKNKCVNCLQEYDFLIYLAMYGYLCKECYPEIAKDYLK